jgi:hypothetical protein
VINLGKILSPETGEAEVTKFRFNCEEWGFFQVMLLNMNWQHALILFSFVTVL